MKNTVQSKKLIIPIIIFIAIVIIAVIVFILIGSDSKNKKSTPITFNDTTVEESNTDDMNDTNTVDDEELVTDIDETIPEFYKNAAEQYAMAINDEDEMNTFLEDYFDVKAYVAYDNIDGENDKFLEEYMDTEDDDTSVVKFEEDFRKSPISFRNLDTSVDEQESNSNTTNQNTTENTVENATDSQTNVVEGDCELVKLTNLQQSESDENITKVDIGINIGSDQVNFTMVFYEDLIIYIVDEDEAEKIFENSDFMTLEQEEETDTAHENTTNTINRNSTNTVNNKNSTNDV